MSWTNRVVWQEGMFLRTQHFQQQDRWTEQLVRGRVQALRPHPWGLVEYALDRDLLGTGRFALASAAGVFEDGTPFALPGEADHPPPLDVPDSARNVLVYLALPIRQAGAVEVADSATEGRYAARPFEAYDTHSASPQPAELQIGRLRMRYLLETDERTGYLCIGLARITEITADRRIVLDERWVPPSLVCSAAAPLAGLIAELSGMLNQRGEALAARMTAPGQTGVAQVADFLLLQSINGWQNVLAHWADAANVHPESLYATLLQMAGEFATFLETRRPNAYPGISPRRFAAQLRPGGRRSASRAVRRAGSNRDSDSAARGASRRQRRPDHRPFHPARVKFRVDRAGGCAGGTIAPTVPVAGQDRRGGTHPRTGERRIAGHCGAALAGSTAATAVLRRGHVFRAGSCQSALAADAELGRLRDPCVWGFPQSAAGTLGDPRMMQLTPWRVRDCQYSPPTLVGLSRNADQGWGWRPYHPQQCVYPPLPPAPFARGGEAYPT